MNILGVGAPELIVIFIIMLVFAGPKRMIHWAYILGQYTAKFRQMWSQTVDLIQKECDEAGVDVKIPKEAPTKQNFQKALSTAFQPVSKPIQDSLDEVNKDLNTVKEFKNEVTKPVWSSKPVEKPVKEAKDTPQKSDLGTWSTSSDETEVQTETNGHVANMGTWSSYQDEDE